MKRPADSDSGSDHKRLKQDSCGSSSTTPDSDDTLYPPYLRRKVSDLRDVGHDSMGFLEGTVYMKWPHAERKLRVALRTKEGGSEVLCEAVFVGTCAEALVKQGISFNHNDVVKLTTRGATINEAKPLGTRPIALQLKYSEGVALTITRRKGAPLSIDTWQTLATELSTEPSPQVTSARDNIGENDWFCTPALPDVQCKMAAEANSRRPKTPLFNRNGTGSLAGSPVLRDAPLTVNASLPEDVAETPVSAPAQAVKNSSVSTELSSGVKADFVSKSVSSSPPTLKRPSDVPHDRDHKASSKASSERGGSIHEDVDPAREGRLGKKKMKKLRREAARLARQNPEVQVDVIPQPQEVEAASDDRGGHKTTQSSPHRHSAKSATQKDEPSVTSKHRSRTTSVHTNSNSDPNEQDNIRTEARQMPSPNEHHLALNLQAGCETKKTRYLPLASLKTAQRSIDVVGVIASCGQPKETRNHEWSCKLIIVDPSTANEEALTGGFTVTYFTKHRAEANSLSAEGLPGRVVIVNGMTTSQNFHTGAINGSLPSFKHDARFCIFDPNTGNLRSFPVKANYPASNMDTGGSETGENDPALNKYLVALGDWWNAINQKDTQGENGVTVHQITAEKQSERKHRLIQDVTPFIQPQGFFDCTVEVIHLDKDKSIDRNFPHILFVTDYTRNTELPRASCDAPPGLEEYIFAIEMWMEAKNRAETMHPGEFYKLKNVRMKTDKYGTREVTVSEDKILKLNPDKLEEHLELQELLVRREEWKRSAAEHPEALPYLPEDLGKATTGAYFRCTVEILYISADKEEGTTYLYVTDYMKRTNLAPVRPFEDRPTDLDKDYILKVELHDEQAATAESLSIGDFVSLSNLRLRGNSSRQAMFGEMRGSQRLIYKLNAKNSASDDLRALLERRAEWQETMKQREAEKTQTETRRKDKSGGNEKGGTSPEVEAIRKLGLTRGTKTFRQVAACSICPARFMVVARVVDFWPLRLEDFVVLYCTQCKEDLPSSYKHCTKCTESMTDSTVVPKYQFFLEIQDLDGDTLLLGFNSTRNTLLRDLEPVDFRDNFEDYDIFRERMATIMGNLEDHREAFLARRKTPEIKTPWLKLMIGSWEGPEGREYVLIEHEVLELGQSEA
ncbi:hypothetical protein K474DRAFT_1662065 [Panus rudis PR-1116 ss-1]|nr:hypothetical protein K474DRAFT_1662065 [Panus rudis PR-1116 ss-1]